MIVKLLETAIEAAQKAGDILLEGFGTDFIISNKEGKNNLVTEYDKLSEDFIIDFIKKRYPEHTFLAEESGKSNIQSINSIRWVIDPLDGTVNFAHNLPIFSVSIAAELNGEILCGVVFNPVLNEMFTAYKDGGAFLNGKPLMVSVNNELEKAFLVTGFPYNISANPCGCIDQFVQLILQGIPVRRLGSAALDLAYVAAGRFDGFWEIDLNPWDVAAGVILVKEAGGTVTQYNNNDYKLGSQSLIATNGLIHEQIRNYLMRCSCGIRYDY